jgi:hypothetical protein
MISIADAIILAGLVGLLGFLWHEKFRMEMLEQENDDLWEDMSTMIDHIRQVEEKVEGLKNGNETQD